MTRPLTEREIAELEALRARWKEDQQRERQTRAEIAQAVHRIYERRGSVKELASTVRINHNTVYSFVREIEEQLKQSGELDEPGEQDVA